MIDCPAEDGVRGELSAVVGDDHSGLTAGCGEHRQLAGNPSARDRSVGDCLLAFAGYIINNVEDAEAAAQGELVGDEVERPARVDPGPRPGSGPGFQPARPPGPALANRQPFLPVKPVDAIDARGLAFPSQQDEQPPVLAKPAACRRQLTQPDANGRVVRPKAEITHRGPISPNRFTRPPLTDLKTRTKMSHSLPPCDGRHH